MQSYLEFQLDTICDKSQVLSLEQAFSYISENTNGMLNEEYFEMV